MQCRHFCCALGILIVSTQMAAAHEPEWPPPDPVDSMIGLQGIIPCESDADCDDGDPCNGLEWCDPELGCMAGDVWVDAEPPCNGTMPQIGRKVIRLWFHEVLPPATGGLCEVRELLPDEQYGPDLSDDFVFDVEENLLSVREQEYILENQKWYGLFCDHGIGAIGPFEYHFTLLKGDASGDCMVNFFDIAVVNSNIPGFPPLSRSQLRSDLNGYGGINLQDLVIPFHFIPTICAPKPSGH